MKNISQGVYSPCVYRHQTRRLSYSVHVDEFVGLGEEADLEWYRQQVRPRLVTKLRGCLGPAAHHKRETLKQNRVLTWRSSEAGRTEMITNWGGPRSVDLLVCDCGLEHGKRWEKTVLWDKPAFLAKNSLAGAYLPANLGRSLKGRCMRSLFIALGRPDVRSACKEIRRAMAQPTIKRDQTLKGLARYCSTAPGLLSCYRRQLMLSNIVGSSEANKGSDDAHDVHTSLTTCTAA